MTATREDQLDETIANCITGVRNHVLEAVLAIVEHEIELTGDGRMVHKRIRRLYESLNEKKPEGSTSAPH
jgi:hypothetical protein